MFEISICIPVYGTENYLKNCLESIGVQTCKNFEIVVVNDFSSGVDNRGYNCKKIVKEFKKKYKIPINYIEHSRNLGVLEARRTGVEAAKGDYIFVLDSDDMILPNSLEILYGEALKNDYDIIHGSADLFYYGNFQENIKDSECFLEINKKISNVYNGKLNDRDIFRGFLVEKNHCGFLWAKLIKREVYLEAFSHIPPIFCTMADDFIQYFWISFFAKTYFGVNKTVYKYFVDTGISSEKIIDNLLKWEQVCSASSVFTALFSEIEKLNYQLTDEENDSLVESYYYYIGNNLIQWKKSVDSKIKDEAFNMLCDFWGENIVNQIYKKLSNEGIL